MTRLSRVFAALAAAALIPALAAAYAAELRPPIKPWVLDYGDTACTAMRSYGKEKSPITLAFRPSPNGTVVRLVVIRPGMGPDAVHFRVTTNMSAQSVRTTGLRFGPKGGKGSDIIWINLARSDLDALPAAGEIAIKGSGVIDERFALPGIATVLKGLDACNADLRKYWNVDNAGVALVTSAQPRKPLASYFSNDDYPSQAVVEGASGIARIILMIDETGALKDCLVEETSGIATLDAMACIALRERAKFTPALDSAGKPVRSVLSTRTIWRLP